MPTYGGSFAAALVAAPAPVGAPHLLAVVAAAAVDTGHSVAVPEHMHGRRFNPHTLPEEIHSPVVAAQPSAAAVDVAIAVQLMLLPPAVGPS